MSETPVACTLGSERMKTRGEEWRSLLRPNVVDRSVISGGVRLVLKRSRATREELDRLIALESSCCEWIAWKVREDSSSLLIVDATADQEEGVALLRDWFAPRIRPMPTPGVPTGA